MSEEEAIKILNTYKGNLSQQKKNPKITKAIDRIIDALEEKNIFLDLYNKEKEKNNSLSHELRIYKNETISKNKIRELIRDYSTPKEKGMRFMDYDNVEPFLIRLQNLLKE